MRRINRIPLSGRALTVSRKRAGKKVFTVRTVKHCDMLSGEVLASPLLEILKAQIDRTLDNQIKGLLRVRGWSRPSPWVLSNPDFSLVVYNPSQSPQGDSSLR